MKKTLLLLIASLFAAVPAIAGDKPLFGPEQFDVVERYGKENRYTRTFEAREGMYLIKIKNGDKAAERSEFIELIVNNEKILREDLYDFFFAACVVPLKKENTFEIAIKDNLPSGMKRPVLPPRFVTVEVFEAGNTMPRGVFGLTTWDSLSDTLNIIDKIRTKKLRDLAVAAESLQNEIPARTEALRALADAGDPDSAEFFRMINANYLHKSEIRAEAAIGLALLRDKTSIPVLMRGVLDSDETLRVSSARALSFFDEAETQKPLTDALLTLDGIRRAAVVRAITDAGWKPVSTLLTLAEFPDPSVSMFAIEILGRTGDKRAADFLLTSLEKGPHPVLIASLANTGDRRAIEPLLSLAKDPVRRKGIEVELANGLATLGEQRAAGPIGDMIKITTSRWTYQKLNEAYKILTGRDFYAKQ